MNDLQFWLESYIKSHHFKNALEKYLAHFLHQFKISLAMLSMAQYYPWKTTDEKRYELLSELWMTRNDGNDINI